VFVFVHLPPTNAGGNAFGRVCLRVCPVCALTFGSLNLESSFWYAGTFSEYLCKVRTSPVTTRRNLSSVAVHVPRAALGNRSEHGNSHRQ